MSHASQASDFLKHHVAERQKKNAVISKSVESILLAADDIENNSRTALGLQLQNANRNQKKIEASAKELRLQVSSLGKKCATYGSQYESLIQSIADMGSIEHHLVETDNTLARIGAHLESIATQLSSE